MLTQTVAKLNDLLPHLTVLVAGASKQARVGTRLRLYGVNTANMPATLHESVVGLMAGGAKSVKVYDGALIYTASYSTVTGILSWNTRNTSKVRVAPVVEVAL